MESGFCNSLPISNVNSSGTIPNIVVNEVMIIGRRRRRPASWIASIKGTPSFRSSLIASSFKIESFMMIPQVTTIPIALIRFKVCPHIHNTSKEAATSIGISSRTIKGCKKLSNCAAKILKANPDKKYKVAGYADKATGSASWNQKLSEKRAQVVYDALIAEGVSKDQLELVGFGGTENMFGKNFLNRVVILE